MGTKNEATRYKVIYYPKFYYELNHIQYFGCDKKSWTWHNCKYTIERLREDVP